MSAFSTDKLPVCNRPSFCHSAVPVGRELSVGFRHELPFDMLHANVGNADFLPSDADFGSRSIARLAKINERLKLGMLGRALNGDLWVVSIYGLRPPITADQNVIQIDIKFWSAVECAGHGRM